MKHLVIYGSEECIENAFGSGHLVQRLLNYNTVLHGGKADSLFNQIKGGSVDRGGPVRTAAKELYEILSDKEKIYRLRIELADPNSLVPVGNHEEVAFQSSDLVKRGFSKPKQLKSNLAKQKNGFGSGYNPRDAAGRMVVGAAHSVEEMLAMAEKEKTKYCDDVNDPQYQRRQEQIKREKKKKEEAKKKSSNAAAATTPDLLDLNVNAAPQVSSFEKKSTPTNEIFDVFDAPVQQPSTFDQQNLLHLQSQPTEIEHKNVDILGLDNFGNSNVNTSGDMSNSILDLTSPLADNISNSKPAKNIMEMSSNSCSAISSMDVFPSELSSTFDNLSIQNNTAGYPSDPPQPLPTSPPPPIPTSPPPPPPTSPPPIEPHTNPFNVGTLHVENTAEESFSMATPLGGNSMENPIHTSNNIYGSQVISNVNSTNFQSQHSLLSNMNTASPNMMMNLQQPQQLNMNQQKGSVNPSMNQALGGGLGMMMTPEQQQFFMQMSSEQKQQFLQQQQMMLTAMMSQCNMPQNGTNNNENSNLGGMFQKM